MTWRLPQSEAHRLALASYGPEAAEAWAAPMPEAGVAAHLSDLLAAWAPPPNLMALEVGAGGGAFTQVLARLPLAQLTVLEPSAPMLAALMGRQDLPPLRGVVGFGEVEGEASLFPEASFDLVAGRQVANGLHDPLGAFRLWRRWLRPGGTLVLVEGLFGREAWAGDFAAQVDHLPLAASQSLATLPYFLEAAGFCVAHAARMATLNALPSSRFERFLVVAHPHA